MDDLISRQAAVDALNKLDVSDGVGFSSIAYSVQESAISAIQHLPSAQSEVRPIDYQDCSNALLEMWMDNVVTDGEFNRIMDKLNAHWGKKDG